MGARPITRAEAADALPAAAEQPCFANNHRAVVWRPSRHGKLGGVGPAVEKLGRRTRIDGLGPAVLFVIEKNVHQRISHFARGFQCMSMIPIAPDAPSRSQEPIDVTGDADGKPFHPSRQAPSVIRLDEKVDVIRLHAEVDDANEPALRRAQLLANAAKE
jgi:hypothetical protein